MKILKYLLASFLIHIFLFLYLYANQIIGLTGFILLLLFIFFIHFLIFRHFQFLFYQFFNLNNTVEDILNGNLQTRIISNDNDQNRELNANINRLAKKIEKMTLKKEEDEQTIQNLTNNIPSPIIYIDRDGRIRYVNNQFINLFQVNVEVNEIYEKLRIRKLYKFIDDAFVFETKEVNTLQIEDKYYQANAIPLYSATSFIGILFIFHDITEIKKYEKLQQEFLADASHELKTPISAIKGASEILLNGDIHSQETYNDFLKIIKDENERMERTVSDILLISRIESENIRVHMDKVNLYHVISESIDLVRFKIDKKYQNIHISLEKELYIKGDYEKLKRVFMNLLVNAINYTNEKKAIYVTAFERESKIIVSIRDEGIGIEAQYLPHIFERFYRIDKARSRETGGTGLGLAIVKSSLDLHKATIKVNSKINEGSEFVITFNKYIK